MNNLNYSFLCISIYNVFYIQNILSIVLFTYCIQNMSDSTFFSNSNINLILNKGKELVYGKYSIRFPDNIQGHVKDEIINDIMDETFKSKFPKTIKINL